MKKAGAGADRVMGGPIGRRRHERGAKRRSADDERQAVGLFSSAGIGELGLDSAGISVTVASELVPYRAALYRRNFPTTMMVEGDIWTVKDEIIAAARDRLGDAELFMVYATPPCQGMSSNGAGKLQYEIEAGRRDHEEPRNRLIIPTVDIINELRPQFVLLENVPQMMHTVIRNEEDEPERILDFVERKLGPDYVGRAEVLACEDFGIPQRRKRLITVFSRHPAAVDFYRRNGDSYIDPSLRSPGPTLAEAIGHLPPLDATPGANEDLAFHPQHRVPVMNPLKYWWVSHTPEGATAFNNGCVNPDCLSSRTPGHREERVDGKWTSVKDTPIYCDDCGDLLPRPTVTESDGTVRSLRGFHSAYRRMRWDQPARTVTQNFIYEASDNKVHPSQNRVLSVYEAMIVQSMERYEYSFTIDGADIGIPKIAEVIGESVPPLLIETISAHLATIADGLRTESAVA